MRMTNSAVLRKAADHMKKFGHVKGLLEDDEGRVCLLGAINFALVGEACSMPNRSDTLLGHVRRYLKKRFGWNEDAVEWNNAPERSGEEVIAALRGTARAARRHHG
jgi:hypothetical protein